MAAAATLATCDGRTARLRPGLRRLIVAAESDAGRGRPRSRGGLSACGPCRSKGDRLRMPEIYAAKAPAYRLGSTAGSAAASKRARADAQVRSRRPPAAYCVNSPTSPRALRPRYGSEAAASPVGTEPPGA